MRKLLPFILISLLWACNEKPFFKEIVEMPEESWNHDDTIKFKVMVEDIESTYDLHLDINHEDYYPYQNLYLKIITAFPGGKRTQEQISIELAEKSGKWSGKCRRGQCRIKVYLLESFYFPEKGEYKFIVAQHTREEELEGINQMGLSLFKRN
ncbi:MAG: gliding motility lipoprotein GldH [Saprospiraceae bacterium]|nr:gliding motility lipoprotein GldH [Saprospiraceae bacterium]